MSSEREPDASRSTYTQLAFEHVGLVVATTLALVTVLHVWAVVGYDKNAALAALGVINQGQVLLASIVIVVVSLLPFAIAHIDIVYRYTKYESDVSPAVRTVAIVGSYLCVILAVATFSVLLITAILLTVVAIWFRKRRARRRGALSKDGKIVVSTDSYHFSRAMLASTFALIALSQLATPWAPREDLEVKGTDGFVTGWVLGSSDDGSTLLKTGSRVKWVRTDSITSRRLCEDDSEWIWRSLPSLLKSGRVECTG